jgi:putative ABC transport system permease protein
VVASVVAGWIPARAAARTPPAHAMQRAAAPAAGLPVLGRVSIGLGLIATGVVCAWMPPVRWDGGVRFPVAGYAAALLWIAGGGIIAGRLLPTLRGALRLVPASAAVTVAWGHLRRPSGRHRLAVAALHCAVGMTAGMVILVASFDETVRGWIGRSLQADLYVSSGTGRGRITPATVEALRQHPAVVDLSALTVYPVVVDGLETQLQGGTLTLIPDRVDLSWVRAPGDRTVFDSSRNESLALVSEAFSERFRRSVGDRLIVPTPTGEREFRIAGIFADYGNERGSILVERKHVLRWFDNDHATNVSLWVHPTVDPDQLRAELAAQYPALNLVTNARLRTEILRIFRQTFAITYALELIGVVVAVVGLALTLSSVLLDRRDELTTLRALGFSRRELAWATALEGGGVAMTGALAGLALSLGLAWLLIYVINKQSFGWTLGFAIPGGTLLALAAAVVSCGAIVGWSVGRWAANLPADRDEE